MFKQLSNMMSMMGGLRDLGPKMEEMNEKLKSQRVVGSTGGGMVEVEANGNGEVLEVRIDDAVLKDREMLLDLLPAAINQANSKAAKLKMETTSEVMNLPGLDQAMAQFTGESKS
ncbi:MAG: YbaB/EbfC family nucleoid-associated protein [Planctomycetota bacterium]|nr:YbaB/EbfC family nucleoid-associated protein [Planctomycetota bacterium]